MQAIHRILLTLHPKFPDIQLSDYQIHLERDDSTLRIEINSTAAPCPYAAAANLHIFHRYVNERHNIKEIVATCAVVRPRMQSLNDIIQAEAEGILVGWDGLPVVFVLTGHKFREGVPFAFRWNPDGTLAEPRMNPVLRRAFLCKWDKIIDAQGWLLPTPRRRSPPLSPRRVGARSEDERPT